MMSARMLGLTPAQRKKEEGNKPAPKKKPAPKTVVHTINEKGGAVGKALTPRTTLMRALVSKKKPKKKAK